MNSVILTQISAQSTSEFHININSMQLNPSINVGCQIHQF